MSVSASHVVQPLRRALAMSVAMSVALLSAMACNGDQVPLLPPVRAISCVATRATSTVLCTSAAGTTMSPPEVDSSGTAVTLRAQGADVQVFTDSAVWLDDQVSLNIAVENLATQPLGIRDGLTADPRGVTVQIVPLARATAGGTSSMATATLIADSGMVATGSAARFTDVIESGRRSTTQRIRLRVPRNAAVASFALIVIAPVPYPHGWLSASDAAVTIGTPVTLRAQLRDAVGRPTATPGVAWTTLSSARVQLTSSGTATGRETGLAQILASCAPTCAAAPDTVTIAVTAPGDVTLAVRPTMRFPISRYIYGANFITDDGLPSIGRWPWFGADIPRGVTLSRIGGNRLSAYNWRNNFSHAGLDYQFQNDQLLDPSQTPGEAVRRRVAAAMERNAGTLVTIPMLPFLAGDAEGKPLDTLSSTHSARMRAHFVPNRATRGAGDPPNAVYQDEFVRWLNSTFPTARTDSIRPLFYSLDNEPDIWYETHRAIMSDTLGKRHKETYDGFTNTSIAFAQAVKSVVPTALVFGPATATYTGVASLGRYPDPDPVHGKAPFFEFYLDRMRAAEQSGGRRVLDVLDMHWYAEAFTRGGPITNDYAPQDEETIQKRLQAPRSLWDSTYNEGSWVSGYTKGPIALLPRLRRMIARHYPGTKLAITEYYYGRSGDISGGLAQADVLGIFGREGVFAATLWPQANVWAWKGVGNDAYAYAFGAFRLYRNYDGAGGTFGETGLMAASSDNAKASIYASRRADGRVVLIVINKTNATLNATIPMSTGPQPTSAQIYTMQHGAPVPVRGADISVAAGSALRLAMPAYSASTLVLNF